jgi:hypothetical protein
MVELVGVLLDSLHIALYAYANIPVAATVEILVTRHVRLGGIRSAEKGIYIKGLWASCLRNQSS